MNERYSRQKDTVPMDKLQDLKITVVGIGAIGRNTAIQLASLGAQNLQLVDFDIVEESNIASQGYYERDLGETKVDVTAKLCKAINSGINVKTVNSRFARGLDVGNVIFTCVDSIKVREFIWDAVNEKIALYIDGRMAAEVLRILSVDRTDIISKHHYPKTLFKEEDAYAGSCTAKSTIYCSNIAAGFLVGTFVKWLRGAPIDKDIIINLLTNQIFDCKE